MTSAEQKQADRKKLREDMRQAMGVAGVSPAELYENDKVKVGMLRRRGALRSKDRIHGLTLIEDDNGVLLWQDGMVPPRSRPGLRRGLAGPVAQGEVVDHFVIEPLEPSKVGQELTKIDARLTPKQGLRQWTANGLSDPDPALKPQSPNGKGILLVVHGTFSESQAIFDQWTSSQPAFLPWAVNRYDQILAFDHPTLSVSPMLNALDLARRFRDCNAPVDIVCHSRGGLVTRWFLEAFDHATLCRRAVFVGAPLYGTSLASPPNLRRVMSWFSNLNKFVAQGAELGSSLMPFLTVVSSLARFTAMVAKVAADTPFFDAAVAMVPGLAAMSRTSNNFEFTRLNSGGVAGANYFVIKSHYKPLDPGWKFWEYFVDAKQRAAHFLFPGENDLVVDTNSMPVIGVDGETMTAINHTRVCDLGESNTIYHTNYFRQEGTSQHITQWLNQP
jgi:hypothetical protein